MQRVVPTQTTSLPTALEGAPRAHAHGAMGNAGSDTVQNSDDQVFTDDNLQEIFQNYDKDESGDIDCTELGEILENILHIKPSESSLKDLIAEVDINKDGSLQFDEFHELVRRPHHLPCL